MDGGAGCWTTSGNIGLPLLARVMGVGSQQQQQSFCITLVGKLIQLYICRKSKPSKVHKITWRCYRIFLSHNFNQRLTEDRSPTHYARLVSESINIKLSDRWSKMTQSARGWTAEDICANCVSFFPCPYNFFCAKRPSVPAAWLVLILTKAGKVKFNPGPTAHTPVIWICDLCHKPINTKTILNQM